MNFLSETGKGAYVTTLKKADLLVPSVSAASIIAKVARDTYMEEMAEQYSEYGFEKHVGYGTAAHRAAIEQHGVTPLHRLSFAPLAKYRRVGRSTAADVSESKQSKPRTSKQTGDRAEDVAAQYLMDKGHEIIARNWKTKFCEIDIVSRLDETVYFTEVKYRRQSNQGGGIAAVTPKKLRQMKFAAEYFALKHQLHDTDLRLGAIEVSGDDFGVTNYVTIKQ